MTATDLLPLGTATLAEAWPATRIVDAPLRPLAPGMALAGPALTLRCRPGDNLALHLAIAAARPGQVLVADYGGSLDSGPFGEIMALACQMRGIAGLVIDGAVRDGAQIAALGFPVFARGVNIRGTVKHDRGQIGGPVTLGGVVIATGDIMLADADAIVSLAAADLPAALAAATARAAREAAMMHRLRQGETTLDILGLGQESGT
ncbi:RraA family protein [Rhodobacter sp. Har01]|uniref:RraA family protein n=1 Tax=Rhodobacter sp. Har01 TaxID=2883999 RepID=UPI001D08340F|nr:RraA family protein [Rhodobacter sp. Har01]MCB6178589.1 RraA family protein [Rhodobacter sp. Har01]